MDDQAQDALDLMPLLSLVSSLGGWALLQNAKFDEKNFFWETLEGQMHLIGLDGLIGMSVHTDPINENDGGILTVSFYMIVDVKTREINIKIWNQLIHNIK